MMKTMLFSRVVLGLLIFSVVPNLHGQTAKPLDATYDPAKNETTVYLSRKNITVATYASEPFIATGTTGAYISKPESLRLEVFFKCIGNEPKVPDSVVVRLDSTGSGRYRYAEERSFRVIADSAELHLGSLDLVESWRDTASRGINGAYYEETLEKRVELSDYFRIIRAKRVEMKVGDTEFRLSDKDLKTLRSFAERLKL